MSNNLYEEALQRARELAAERRAAGDIPEGLTQTLDDLFLEVAPIGARSTGEGPDGLLEMLSHFAFDPEIPASSTRPRFGFFARSIKRILRPIASWQLRHLTDQLNAYHSAQIELLRVLLEDRKKEGGTS